MRDTERQREKQAPCREIQVRLDLRTPGSHPEPKAVAQLLSHPGVPLFKLLESNDVSPLQTFPPTDLRLKHMALPHSGDCCCLITLAQYLPPDCLP